MVVGGESPYGAHLGSGAEAVGQPNTTPQGPAQNAATSPKKRRGEPSDAGGSLMDQFDAASTTGSSWNMITPGAMPTEPLQTGDSPEPVPVLTAFELPARVVGRDVAEGELGFVVANLVKTVEGIAEHLKGRGYVHCTSPVVRTAQRVMSSTRHSRSGCHPHSLRYMIVTCRSVDFRIIPTKS